MAADHDINVRSQQIMMVTHWQGIAKFILERITAIIPKMQHFYLGGAQDSYRIISVHIEKLMASIQTGGNLFPQSLDATTSDSVNELMERLNKVEIPPVVDVQSREKRPLKKSDEFVYETKDNIVWETYIHTETIQDEEGKFKTISHPELDYIKVYQKDTKNDYLHDALIEHYKKYGANSNPATIGRCSKDCVGLAAAKQPDYYIDPNDLLGYWTVEDNSKQWDTGGNEFTPTDIYEGLYVFHSGIVDPSFVGSTRWYTSPTCLNYGPQDYGTGKWAGVGVKGDEDGDYNDWDKGRDHYLSKQVYSNKGALGPYWSNQGTWPSGLKPGWIWSMGYEYKDEVGTRWINNGDRFVRWRYDVSLDSTGDTLFKNVDMGMLLHESPVDPDVYVFGYSYYKSMIRSLIYNLKGLKVGMTVQMNQPSSGRFDGCNPWPSMAYDAYKSTIYNNSFAPIDVKTAKYMFLAPGKWIEGTTIIKHKWTGTYEDMGFGKSGYNGSPNAEKHDWYDDMDSFILKATVNIDIWKNFKGQCELNRYYYPLSQIYDSVDSSYNNRFLHCFGEADYNLVDLYQYKGTVYNHGPQRIRLLLDDTSIVPLYLEVLSTEVKEDGTTADKEVNIHFSGGQETWFSPYFNWTFSVASLIYTSIGEILTTMNSADTTDADCFNMYQKIKEYATFFQMYAGTIVRILAVPPLGGESLGSSPGSLGSANGNVVQGKRKKLRIKRKDGSTLHEFLSPFTGSDK